MLPSVDADDLEDVPGEEAEAIEEQIADQATAAATLAEFEAEIIILRDLEAQALRLKLSGQDAKWRQLESILDDPIMLDPTTGLRRKILIFTEPKDMLEYLQQKIAPRVGDPAAVVVIHGGIAREARRGAIAAFNSDPIVRVMIANDVLKHRDRLIGRGDPVLDRYARVTFDKALIAGKPQAELVAPGHPLLESVVDVVLERFQPLLQQGAVLVDETDEGTAPRLLVYLEHAIRDGRTVKSGEPRVVSQRLQFIHLREDGAATDGGPAPYLDYRPITPDERILVADQINAPWLSGRVEDRALAYAIATLVPDHLAEVKRRRLAEIDKVEREVRARLNRETTPISMHCETTCLLSCQPIISPST